MVTGGTATSQFSFRRPRDVYGDVRPSYAHADAYNQFMCVALPGCSYSLGTQSTVKEMVSTTSISGGFEGSTGIQPGGSIMSTSIKSSENSVPSSIASVSSAAPTEAASTTHATSIRPSTSPTGSTNSSTRTSTSSAGSTTSPLLSDPAAHSVSSIPLSPSSSHTPAPSVTAAPRHIPAIVGSVVGGAALVILLVTWVLLRRHRKRKLCKVSPEAGTHPFTSSAVGTRRTFSLDSPHSPRRFKATFSAAIDLTSSVDAVTGSDSTPDETPPDMRRDRACNPIRTGRSTHPQRDAKASKSPPLIDETTQTCAVSTQPVPAPPNPPLGGAVPTDIAEALAHDSPALSSTTLTLIRSLLQRNPVQNLRLHRAEVDSGLRIYDDADMPPPEYTAE